MYLKNILFLKNIISIQKISEMASVESNKSRKRCRDEMTDFDPFGFDLGVYLRIIKDDYKLGRRTHHISNSIVGFENGQPVFKENGRALSVVSTLGLYAYLGKSEGKKPISELHNNHTVSLYAVAAHIRKRLMAMESVHMRDSESSGFKYLDMRKARHQKRHSEKNVVWMNARHLSRVVVLKTTTDHSTQLKYILDAVIHNHVFRICPNYLPRLHFVGFAAGGRLVVCSEQLTSLPVAKVVQHVMSDSTALLEYLVKDVCLMLKAMQQKARFTHRDCHVSNVYYDVANRKAQLIDFDWSCVRLKYGHLSVPRYLYDTTRKMYCQNQSIDVCIFLRTLGPILPDDFHYNVYQPLMDRYEKQSAEMLRRKSKDDAAAIQLYKMATDDKTMRGKYSHQTGLERFPKVFEYAMGYYEWECMTPDAVLQFISQ